jgi:hypothetical protein
MTNANHDLTPPEYIPYPKRAPVVTHDIIEIDNKKNTKKRSKK